MGHEMLSCIRVITRGLYQINNRMQWSSVFSMQFCFQLGVWKMVTYLRCVDTLEDRAGAEETNRMTGCELGNARGGVMAH